MEHTIQFTDVTKHIGNFALQQISFEIPMGYLIGLIGPNGSGKTTLLNLLCGLYRPDTGTISIDGKRFPEDERILHDEMGCVLQERLFDGSRTLLENAGYYGKYYSAYSQSDFLSYCSRLALMLDCRYKKLSKGEELKFQFAFALSHHPKVLLLDEPTGNFDPEFRGEFLKWLSDFVSDGAHSIILATHLTTDLDRMADYILYLEKGRLLLSMDIESLRDAYRLVTGEAYKIRLLPRESVISMEYNSMEYNSIGYNPMEVCSMEACSMKPCSMEPCSMKSGFMTRSTGSAGYGGQQARALISHKRWMKYDRELTVTPPTLEELMYFITFRDADQSIHC